MTRNFGEKESITLAMNTSIAFRPETDLDAYARSIDRLANLASQIKLVLGAHNVPVAEPSVLPRLVTAFAKARTGKATGVRDSAGVITYSVDGFKFRMSAPGTNR